MVTETKQVLNPNALIEVMNEKQLLALKAQHKGNVAIEGLVDQILADRSKAKAEAELLEEFGTKLKDLFKTLPHPEIVRNIYVAWREVATEVGEPAEVEIPAIPATATAPAVPAHKELRKRTILLPQWVIETNKGFDAKSGKAGSGTPLANKRAVIVRKRTADDRLEVVGKYPSATAACNSLRLTIGGDSANRVLSRSGYFVEAYNGTDFSN